MTLHSAKGLEFPVVFMVGMENGIFPGKAALNDDREMQESRRLCYVGITRAKEKLYMTSAEIRRVFGRTEAHTPSDFLNEVPGSLKEYVSGRGYASRFGGNSSGSMNIGSNSTTSTSSYNPHSVRNSEVRPMGAGAQAYNLNSVAATSSQGTGKMLTSGEATLGRKIKHSKFGVGTIVSISKDGSDVKLSIAFDTQGIKSFMLGMAPLEVI
jgi:DNA helicase-2/ATP-dependent DNA helicase PcrA